MCKATILMYRLSGKVVPCAIILLSSAASEGFLCAQNKEVEVPGVRNGHVMVYHAALKGLFMFGGANEHEVRGDTWLWSKQQWQKLSSRGPVPRTFASMVYRNKARDVVLFGGNKVLFGGDDKQEVLLNDTWIWKEGKWNLIETKDRPEPRSEASMAYDIKNDKVILFGGFKFSQDGKTLIRFNDTWEFDGENWRRRDIFGPSARSGSTMVYDQLVGKVILFGGNFPRSTYEKSVYNGTTWTYSESRWDSVSGAPNIYNSSMAYDKDKGRIIRFGGWNGSQRVNETWEFRKLKWRKLDPDKLPEPRNHSLIIYDAQEKSVLLFGGHNGEEVFGDIWRLKNSSWRRIYNYPKRKRVDNSH